MWGYQSERPLTWQHIPGLPGWSSMDGVPAPPRQWETKSPWGLRRKESPAPPRERVVIINYSFEEWEAEQEALRQHRQRQQEDRARNQNLVLLPDFFRKPSRLQPQSCRSLDGGSTGSSTSEEPRHSEWEYPDISADGSETSVASRWGRSTLPERPRTTSIGSSDSEPEGQSRSSSTQEGGSRWSRAPPSPSNTLGDGRARRRSRRSTPASSPKHKPAGGRQSESPPLKRIKRWPDSEKKVQVLQTLIEEATEELQECRRRMAPNAAPPLTPSTGTSSTRWPRDPKSLTEPVEQEEQAGQTGQSQESPQPNSSTGARPKLQRQRTYQPVCSPISSTGTCSPWSSHPELSPRSPTYFLDSSPSYRRGDAPPLEEEAGPDEGKEGERGLVTSTPLSPLEHRFKDAMAVIRSGSANSPISIYSSDDEIVSETEPQRETCIPQLDGGASESEDSPWERSLRTDKPINWDFVRKCEEAMGCDPKEESSLSEDEEEAVKELSEFLPDGKPRHSIGFGDSPIGNLVPTRALESLTVEEKEEVANEFPTSDEEWEARERTEENLRHLRELNTPEPPALPSIYSPEDWEAPVVHRADSGNSSPDHSWSDSPPLFGSQPFLAPGEKPAHRSPTPQENGIWDSDEVAKAGNVRLPRGVPLAKVAFDCDQRITDYLGETARAIAIEAEEVEKRKKSGWHPPLVLTALCLLTAGLPMASAEATQRRVGKVVSPAAMSVLHFHVSPREIDHDVARILHFLNVSEEAAKSSPEATHAIRKIRVGAEKQLEVRQEQLLRLHHLLALTPLRHKRVVPLLLIAGVAVGAGLANLAVTLGFGISNRMTISEVQSAVASNSHNISILWETVRRQGETAEANFRIIQQELAGMRASDLVRFTELEVRVALLALSQKMAGWERGAYHLHQGVLDPAFVTPEDLENGLQVIATRAAEAGMRVVPFESPAEMLFTMPVSGALNGTGLDIFVTVPLMPGGAPVFELFKMGHTPIPVGNGTHLDFVVTKSYLLVDTERTINLAVSQSELNACPNHKDLWYCDFRTFSRSVDSCAAALFFGDQNAAPKLCQRLLSKKPVVVTPAANSSFDLEVWTAEKQTIVQVCPNQQDRPLNRFQGSRVVPMGPGCSLRTESSVTFHTDSLPEIEVACRTEEWQESLLLGGLSIDDFALDIEEAPLQRVDLAQRAEQKKREEERRDASPTHSIAVGSAVLGGVLLLLFFCKAAFKSRRPLLNRLRQRGLPRSATRQTPASNIVTPPPAAELLTPSHHDDSPPSPVYTQSSPRGQAFPYETRRGRTDDFRLLEPRGSRNHLSRGAGRRVAFSETAAREEDS